MATPAKVTVASLGTPDHDGSMTKQGGSWKSWKKRWFILKGRKLYYFKAKTDLDATGVIELHGNTIIQREGSYRGKKHCFSIGYPDKTTRTFYMYPETDKELEDWVKALQNAISGGGTGAGNSNTGPSKTVSSPRPAHTDEKKAAAGWEPSNANTSTAWDTKTKIDQAKDAVPFLQDESSKVLEFWQIWKESIPPTEEQAEAPIVFEVATSADMEKLNWRASGPQNNFIQRMVDFFWNVGAPEAEIDRLNDVGALINPTTIGSWIDMSIKGGMDGGWFFPVEVPVKFALEACDNGDARNKLAAWAESNGITRCTSVGRDMGAAPPRQTEITFFLPGQSFEEQLERGLSAYSDFGFPPIVDDALEILRKSGHPGLSLSVITSSEGFVRLGLVAPNPSQDIVRALCELSGAGSSEQIFTFEKSLGCSSAHSVEYQFLNSGFGYGVYKEGFDVVFHYQLS